MGMELGPTSRVFFIGDLMMVNLDQLWGIQGDTVWSWITHNHKVVLG